MASRRTGPELIVWAGPTRSAWVGRLLDVMGAAVTPIGVGGPRCKPVSDLAASSGCDGGDDLRKLIVDRPAAFLLLAEQADVAVEDLAAAANAGTTILVLEPPAEDFDALERLAPIAGSIHLLPAFNFSPGMQAAAHPVETLGERCVIGFDSFGRDTTLFARLWDAWATVLSLATGEPESIDAALTPPSHCAAAQIPEQLSQLNGRFTAHGRLAQAGSVVLELADTTGLTQRSLRVVGENAALCVTDGGYTLQLEDGNVLDQSKPAGPTTWIDLIAHQWHRLLDRPAAASTGGLRGSTGGRPDTRDRNVLQSVLACCLATLLSARTGQPERPADILRMHG